MILSLCCDFYDVHHHFARLFEVGNGEKFVRSVEVQATSKDVGARKTHERQLRSVGATANGLNLGSHLRHFHRFFCNVDDVHHGFHLLTHVIIGVAQGELESLVAIFSVRASKRSRSWSRMMKLNCARSTVPERLVRWKKPS